MKRASGGRDLWMGVDGLTVGHVLVIVAEFAGARADSRGVGEVVGLGGSGGRAGLVELERAGVAGAEAEIGSVEGGLELGVGTDGGDEVEGGWAVKGFGGDVLVDRIVMMVVVVVGGEDGFDELGEAEEAAEGVGDRGGIRACTQGAVEDLEAPGPGVARSEEHTSELQSR